MPTSCSTAIASSAAGTRRNHWPLVTVALGFVMAMLDVTVVNVALDHLQSDLSIPLSGLLWVVDGYTLTFASLLLTGGALANRYGARAIYMTGLAVFITASLMCAIAPNGDVLIAARLAQGIGAALFMPSSLSLLSQSYPDEKERITALGIWSAIVSVAAASGPIVGGAIVATLGWRGIFWLNVPIGLLGLVMARRHLAPSPRRAQALNPVSHTLGMLALGTLAFGLIEGGNLGWSSRSIIAAFVLALFATVAFVIRECREASPIFPRDLFQDARFAATNGFGFLINLGAFGQIFLISLYVEQARGNDAWHTGLNLLPLMAMFTVGNLISARISSRLGTRIPMLFGVAAAAILCPVVVITGMRLPYDLFIPLLMAANLGVGIAIPAMTTTVMQVAGQSHANIAAAALNANRQVGTLIGVAAMGVVLHALPDWHKALPVAFGVITLAYAGAALLAGRYLGGSHR